MSGLCGWFGGGQRAAGESLIATMAKSLTRFDSSAVRSATAGFGEVAAAARGNDADVYHGDGKLVAIWGHVDFSDGGLRELAQQRGAAQALAQGFARQRSDVFAAMSGSFAVAILDGHAGESVLAVDRMGTRPLFYGVARGNLVFGSTLDAVTAFPAVEPQIARQAIYDYVYFHMVPGPDTVHSGVRRMLPGEYVSFRGGAFDARPYWKMRFVENERRPFAELKQTFVELLRDSVRKSTRNGAVGAFLSGGTDSSTIAGVLGDVTGEPARTYSIGFAADGYDEMEYARIAARHFGTRHHEYYVTPDDVVRAIPAIAAVHDQPFGNASAVPTYYCAKLAREDGVETMLGGDGGDELFGGNERYAKQHLYSLYSDLPAALRKGLLDPVASMLPSIGIAGKVQRYMRNAMEPMPGRYDNYNLLTRLGAANVFTRRFLEGVDQNLPPARMAETYQAAHADTLINRMLALDLKYTLADNDLPKVSRSCELAGVAIAYPMLDDALVAFSARLAPREKLKGTRLRYFFKEALRGYLPDEIITKQKHGFGLPFGVWLQTHEPLRQIALDSLTDLKKRDLVRPEFIDELTSTHVQTHADYYGTMVWILMMLEQWLAQHQVTA